MRGLFLNFMFAAVAAAAPSQDAGADYSLWRKRAAASGYEIYYSPGAGNAILAKRLADYFAEREGRSSLIFEIGKNGAAAPGKTTIPVLIGKFTDPEIREQLQNASGSRMDPRMASAQGKAGDVVSFFIEKDGRPLLAFLSNDEKAFAAALNKSSRDPAMLLFPERPGTATLIGGEIERPYHDAGKKILQLGAFTYYAAEEGIGEAEVQKLDRALGACLARFYNFAGRDVVAPMSVVLYKNLDTKIQATGERTLASSQFLARRIDALYDESYFSNVARETARIALLSKYGLFTNGFAESGIVEWLVDETSHAGEWNLPFEDITDPMHRGLRSPTLLARADAELTRSAVAAFGATEWLQITSTGDASANPKFRELLTKNPPPAARVSAAPRRPSPLPIKGFIILQKEGGREANLQFSNAVAQTKAAGANAVLLTAYREPGKRTRGFVDLQCSDDELLWRAGECRRAGMLPIFRTIWLGVRAGGWVGEPFTLASSDWSQYYEDILQIMLHDAALAERMECPWWFFATELRGATGIVDYEPWWHTTISELRKLYHGGLSYAASWDLVPVKNKDATSRSVPLAEFEILTFWKDLDAVSATGFIPLSIERDASDEQINAGAADFARRLEIVAKREGKPLLLAEAGFSATDQSYQFPWRGRGGESTAGQARAYEAFLKYLINKDWFSGILLNGFSADPAADGPRAFSVNSRFAMKYIDDFFSKLKPK